MKQYHILLNAHLDAEGIDDALRKMQAEFDLDKDSSEMCPGSNIDIHRVTDCAAIHEN